MGRYIRDIRDKDDEFYNPIYSFIVLAFAVLFFVALFGLMDTSLKSDNINEKNSLYLALQDKETNNTKSLVTAQIIKEMHNGNFDDWLYLGSLVGNNDTIDNNHNSIGFAILNWNETIEYLENPDKAIPENHIWENAIEWYLGAVAIIFIFATNIGYIVGAVTSELSDVYKYPWKERWALPWVVPLVPYILLTQPFVFLYMVLRKGYEAVIAWNKHSEDVQVQSSRSAEEFKSESESIQVSFEEHSDYVKSKKETDKLERRFKKIVKKVVRNIESSKKNFENFHRIILGKEMDDKEFSIRSLKDELSSLGLKIEEVQKGILIATKQKEDIEKAIISVDPEKTDEEFERILNLPLVEAVEMSDDSNVIDIYTKKIFINYKRKRFELGNFLIALNIGHGSKSIKNLTNTTNYDRHHPYSYDFSTLFCFGKTGALISESLENNDILLATTLILQALQTGEGDSTDKIDYWREVEGVK
ncbi:MAG: hypothetical protein U9P70_03350 [Patescibacteria group bacterium]|nr:hypothetical protein [Patescibacteria group bacterium]